MLETVDIFENDILGEYPKVLDVLLKDRTTQSNIIWATDNYIELGDEYTFKSQISVASITGENGNLIKPRVQKHNDLKAKRVKDKAEVFTPSWICNAQNNLVDNSWFGKANVFNKEVILDNSIHSWNTNRKKITFPKTKTWKDYIKSTRLEMACGEAPYIVSRYDATTGVFIPIENRIGLLDRKLRIINENTETPKEWLSAAQLAYKSIYAFEWQGDSLLLAREAILFSFIEYFTNRFGKAPHLKSIIAIANIISWNIWQMDGLKGVVPESCGERSSGQLNMFGVGELKGCIGCKNGDIRQHNGIYCVIKDWSHKEPISKCDGIEVRFIDLMK